AGPLANFLLAIVIFSGQFLIGIEEPVARAKVAGVESISYQAGLRHGDVILSVNAEPVQTWSQFRWKLLQAAVAHRDAVVSVSRSHPDRSASQMVLDVRLPTAKMSAAELEKDLLPVLGIALYRPPALLSAVQENGPAAKAGLKVGDVVLAIDGRDIKDGQELAETVGRSAGQNLRLTLRRGDETLELPVTPELKTESGRTSARIMVAPDGRVATTVLRYGVVDALLQGASKTWDNTLLTFRMLGKIVSGEISWRNITGPITIADYAGQTARMGPFVYISLIAMLSISLGVMNLLPIPVLDGGHLLYYSLEVLTGKQIPAKYLDMAQRGGLVVLLCLMGIAFFNDVVLQLAKFVQ
ncbi:MAG: RIP metalloprotease RseP, partial [Burkholderiales bacterium]|nr:RIP metalloprotease RseP [Burkholderiales bacterium]